MFIMLRQWNDVWRGFYRLCMTCARRWLAIVQQELPPTVHQ